MCGGAHFETLSLVDTVQNSKVKGYLQAAEAELRTGNYEKAAFEAMSAYGWTISQTKTSMMGRLPFNARAFVISDGSDRQQESEHIFLLFKHMRDTIMRSVVGISFANYRRYRKITEAMGHVIFLQDGGRTMGSKGYKPNITEAEYVVEFATNAVLQIESLVGDIDKPFEV